MTIAEKHIKIAEKEQKVFNAGYKKGKSEGGDTSAAYDKGFADGQQSMVDESKIIEASATGTDILRLNDVSEMPHSIDLQISGENVDLSTVKITVQGKNLFNIDAPFDITVNNAEAKYYSGWLVNPTGETITLTIIDKNPNIDIGELYLGLTENGNCAPVHEWNIAAGALNIPISTADSKNKYLSVYKLDTTSMEAIKERFDIQIEYGSTSTEYESYNGAEYSVEDDGAIENIKSISPTVIFASSVSDVQITANYHKSWGMQTEHDRFWDTILLNGERTDCSNLFYGPAWTDKTFTPNRDIKPTKANYMFRESRIKTSEYLNKVDFSNCAAVIQTFWNSTVEELGTLDFGSVMHGWGGLNQVFYDSAKLRKIELLIPPRDRESKVDTFSGLSALTEITFGGTIYMSISFAKAPLIKTSIVSVMSHLADDVCGMTATFNKAAVDKAFETSEGANDGSTSAEWLAQVDTKPNWTIALA